MTQREARQSAFRFGLGAETIAALYLRVKGYRILARRWRVPQGEVDIIARRHGTLVFVEVKARTELEAAADAVRHSQLRRIGNAARAWLARHPSDMTQTLRFDLLQIAPWRMPRHVVNAFEVDI